MSFDKQKSPTDENGGASLREERRTPNSLPRLYATYRDSSSTNNERGEHRSLPRAVSVRHIQAVPV